MPSFCVRLNSGSTAHTKSGADANKYPIRMNKLITSLALSLLLSSSVAVAQPRPGSGPMPVPAPPELGARSYLLVDFYSDTILVERNADERVEPASITKVMTSYVVFNELAQGNISLDDMVPVSEKAWKTGGSRMFIDPSMQVSVEDLLRGVIIQSGNDASVALAEFVAGSEEAFAGVMNHYAEVLGMVGTNFMNPPVGPMKITTPRPRHRAAQRCCNP